ncbi:phosphotransferase [Actinomycetospora sp. TBRC 11914]|uniref:phosphotransferase n=1 Tax=Actinomycetospora sp. TBRC 11914 TaxID=2729387 RepID=UPI00145F1D9A|nr:phosphotransferase [Actinomycetospora sp. TBRC 11914]NMO91968.1 aminoglycoside phosphotransferase family protein [Actinomycetospora sp. TBRC 11914]
MISREGVGRVAGDSEERFAEVLAWADAHVRRTGPPEARERPWSTVLRLPTADGPVWLKATTAAARAEVGLYRVLAARTPGAVLVPIARDDRRGWLLLPDGGPTLRDGPPERVADGVAAALRVYAALQRAVAPAWAEILAAGVPDASPAALPARFTEAVAATGLDDDVPRRRALVAHWAAVLADSPGADLVTVDHQDLHPGNVLTAGPRFYDWGDAVLAHPFASLLVALGGLARTLGVGPDDPAVLAARDAYLDVFADLAGHRELVRIAEIACRAAVVARALTWHRAVGAAGPDHRFADAPRTTLATLGSASPFHAA